MEQISVGRVDFHHVEAGGIGSARRFPESPNHFIDLGFAHFLRHFAPVIEGDGAGGDDRFVKDRLSSGMGQLNADFHPLAVGEIDQLF